MSAPGQLQIQDHVCSQRHTIRLEGELDIATAPDLYAVVDALAADGTQAITLDLSRLQFIDCKGLQIILAIESKCHQIEAQFALRPGPPAVQRLFALTGIVGRLRWERDAACR